MARNAFQKIWFILNAKKIVTDHSSKYYFDPLSQDSVDSVILFSFGKNLNIGDSNEAIHYKYSRSKDFFKSKQRVFQEEFYRYMDPRFEDVIVSTADFGERTPSSHEVANEYNKLAKATGLSRPLIVAEENHIGRCILILEKMGYKPQALPVHLVRYPWENEQIYVRTRLGFRLYNFLCSIFFILLGKM
jgi:hypothetical protein